MFIYIYCNAIYDTKNLASIVRVVEMKYSTDVWMDITHLLEQLQQYWLTRENT